MYRPRALQQDLSSLSPSSCAGLPSIASSVSQPSTFPHPLVNAAAAITSTVISGSACCSVSSTNASTSTSPSVSSSVSATCTAPPCESVPAATPGMTYPVNWPTTSSVNCTQSTDITVRMAIKPHGVTELILPERYCQSKLLGRSGSNACTIISLLAAMKFLQKEFFHGPTFNASVLIDFISIMVDGNSLYDSLVPTHRLLDVDEAIEVLGLDTTVFVDEYNGVVDLPQLHSLCDKFIHVDGANILTLPPDTTVMILAHKNANLTLFDSHSHGNDGALAFSANCPKTFAAYVERFVKSNSHLTGLLGTNICTIGLRL